MKRRIFRSGLIVALALIAVGAAGAWQYRWHTLPYYTQFGQLELPAPVLSKAQYDAVFATHARPYVVSIDTPSAGAVLLYGASHTKDPTDPQIADIRARWSAMKPTVALCESRLGFFIGGLVPGVRQFGEPGAVFALARESNTPVYTWEPPRERMIRHLRESHAPQRVALFLVLTPYFSNFRHGKPSDPDAAAAKYIRKRLAGTGLENEIRGVGDLDAIWRRDFAALRDWRDTTDAHGLPGYLGELAERFNAYRDEHFARVMIHLARGGERVFAVCGSSHAVKLEPALRAALVERAR